MKMCECGAPADRELQPDGSYPYICNSCYYMMKKSQIFYVNRGEEE